MRRILKYRVGVEDGEHVLDLRGDIVHVGMQDEADALMVWAWHEDDETRVMGRRVIVVGTGHPVPCWADKQYGTVIDERSGLVWHLVGASLPVFPDWPH